MDDLRRSARQAGMSADNLEDVFLSIVEQIHLFDCAALKLQMKDHAGRHNDTEQVQFGRCVPLHRGAGQRRQKAEGKAMRALVIELRKEKRTGVIPVLLAVGILGAAYAFVNFLVRKDTLLNLPLAPMDVLLTQLYGMIMILNLFGIVVASCMIYKIGRKAEQRSHFKCPLGQIAHSDFHERQIFQSHRHKEHDGQDQEFAEIHPRWQSGMSADNLEDVFLSIVEQDNAVRKQRAKL